LPKDSREKSRLCYPPPKPLKAQPEVNRGRLQIFPRRVISRY
jgi:hypothetical protein